jgi:hypothetical protein
MRGMIYVLKKTGENGKAYIGQTVNNKRFSNHKADFKAWLDGKQHYKSSYIVVCEGDFDYEVLEEIDVDNAEELRKREQYFIDQFKRNGFEVVNAFNATKKDDKEYNKRYYEEHKVEIKQKMKEKYLAEREEIIAKNKMYYASKEKVKSCCENCGKELLKTNMKRHLRSCQMVNHIVADLEKDPLPESNQIEENTASS